MARCARGAVTFYSRKEKKWKICEEKKISCLLYENYKIMLKKPNRRKYRNGNGVHGKVLTGKKENSCVVTFFYGTTEEENANKRKSKKKMLNNLNFTQKTKNKFASLLVCGRCIRETTEGNVSMRWAVWCDDAHVVCRTHCDGCVNEVEQWGDEGWPDGVELVLGWFKRKRKDIKDSLLPNIHFRYDLPNAWRQRKGGTEANEAK